MDIRDKKRKKKREERTRRLSSTLHPLRPLWRKKKERRKKKKKKREHEKAAASAGEKRGPADARAHHLRPLFCIAKGGRRKREGKEKGKEGEDRACPPGVALEKRGEKERGGPDMILTIIAILAPMLLPSRREGEGEKKKKKEMTSFPLTSIQRKKKKGRRKPFYCRAFMLASFFFVWISLGEGREEGEEKGGRGSVAASRGCLSGKERRGGEGARSALLSMLGLTMFFCVM